MIIDFILHFIMQMRLFCIAAYSCDCSHRSPCVYNLVFLSPDVAIASCAVIAIVSGLVGDRLGGNVLEQAKAT